MSHSTSTKGFTLVELAIALMVIGLLIGGVLKGQELIENARVTQTIRDIKGYDAAALIFNNTYGALPGDIKKPQRIPGCTEAVCNIPGNGNGRIGDDGSGYEVSNFFPHLGKAGMINGPQGGSEDEMTEVMNAYGDDLIAYLDESDLFLMASAWNDGISLDFLNDIAPSSQQAPPKGPTKPKGNSLADAYAKFYPALPYENVMISVASSSGSSKSHNYFLRDVPLRVADALDSKLDDGYATTGAMRTKEAADQESGGGGKKKGGKGGKEAGQNYTEMSDGKITEVSVFIKAMY